MMLLTKLLRQFGKCSAQTWLEPFAVSYCISVNGCLETRYKGGQQLEF